ncbi:MAG: hypothetical protein ACOYZ7_15065 [Chloroflexota bacterium]
MFLMGCFVVGVTQKKIDARLYLGLAAAAGLMAALYFTFEGLIV